MLHYSGYARGLERLFDSRRRSLLISHNVTPARYFWAHEPVEAVRCELGRAQLAELARPDWRPGRRVRIQRAPSCGD